MATYKGIQGTAVQSLASSTGTIEGQIWYDTANGNFKLQGFQAAAWSSGGSRSNATFRGAGFGTITDAVSSGGTQTSPLPAGPINATTEVYNGTSWTSGTSAPLNLGYVTAGGTSPAGIVNTGESPPGSGTTTIEYASGTWTSGGTQNYAAQNAIGAGTQTSYIQAGGVFQPDYSEKNNADNYDGTSWTSITNYPANVGKGGGAGDASTAFFYGGEPTPSSGTLTNDWNGSSWTAAAVIPTSSAGMAQNNSGPVNGALNTCFGSSTTSLLYNGTSWSTDQAASNASPDGLSGAGGNLPTAGLLKWGSPGPASLTVEEYIGAGVATETITTS
tara:strand:- start:523 stop:1515 length:993 start_codon:yes stop_codon:yes gene_type:complete